MLTHITTLFDELSQRESRVLISEAGLSAPPVTDRATVFTDGRAGRTTILSLSNPNSEPVTVSLVFRDADGSEVSDRIERQIASNGSTAWPLDELQASGPGSVELSALLGLPPGAKSAIEKVDRLIVGRRCRRRT